MAQPKKYLCEVVSIIKPVENIYTVEFRSLSGKFKFQPGQFLHLALDEYDPSSGWPESRCFSIQSSPSSEFLKITFSVKGKFTRRMSIELLPGKVIDLKLPYGELFNKNNLKDNIVFIAGGTGITPFLSLFNDCSFSEYNNPILYLGVRSSEFFLYNNELFLAVRINKSFRNVIRFQDTEGLLDIDRIFEEHGHAQYFISGPPDMILLFRTRLINFGVEERSIITDDWF